MEIYYGAWKILGLLFVVFLAYAIFVVRGQKKENLQDNHLEKN